ncbi:CAP domain-containing protein [Streptomyces sp. PsTaAH-124]|uniref:CAP domain-containing protein n=1 Tax=Streptomyces sp. PsTaAH-124 TaxID=1157638 RepID=UPI00037B1693|nr:CAP domain-containing protein [Streptomyces sp. PsTaAH-124]
MGKHRKHQYHRRIAVAAVAVGVVGIPSAALACGGWPGGGTQQTHRVAEEIPSVQWNPSAWGGSAPGAASGRPASVTPSPTAGAGTALPGASAPSSPAASSSPGTPAVPHPRDASARRSAAPAVPASSAPGSAAQHHGGASAAPVSSHTARPTTPAPTTASPTASDSPAPSASAPSDSAAQILALVNNERAKAGCSALTANPALAAAAQAHSEDMAAHRNMSHTGSDGSAPGDRITAAGYTWSTYGENVAYGYTDAAQVMAAWMDSPGHKANILDCAFKEIGVGLAQPGGYWTQDFGTSR